MFLRQPSANSIFLRSGNEVTQTPEELKAARLLQHCEWWNIVELLKGCFVECRSFLSGKPAAA